MATIKDLLSNMISKIHTKMDAPTVTEADNGKILGVVDGTVGLVEQGSGLPESVSPYQQLVTDGAGNWGAEDRLAYAMPPVQTVVVEEQVTAFEEDYDLVVATLVPKVDTIEPDQKYTVKFDGQTYICTSYFSPMLQMNVIGNDGILDGESGSGEPFNAFIVNGALVVYAQKPAGNYSFGITMDFVAKKKIDGSFLPDASTEQKGIVAFGVGKNLAARVINTYFNATYEELLEAYNAYQSGGVVWRIAGDTVCGVNGSIEHSGMYLFLNNSSSGSAKREDTVEIKTDPENKIVVSMERVTTYSRITFTYDGTNYTCNVPFEKFREVLMSGVPVVLVDTKEGALSMDAVVNTYEDADAAIYSEAFGWNLSYGEDGVSVPAAQS